MLFRSIRRYILNIHRIMFLFVLNFSLFPKAFVDTKTYKKISICLADIALKEFDNLDKIKEKSVIEDFLQAYALVSLGLNVFRKHDLKCGLDYIEEHAIEYRAKHVPYIGIIKKEEVGFKFLHHADDVVHDKYSSDVHVEHKNNYSNSIDTESLLKEVFKDLESKSCTIKEHSWLDDKHKSHVKKRTFFVKLSKDVNLGSGFIN